MIVIAGSCVVAFGEHPTASRIILLAYVLLLASVSDISTHEVSNLAGIAVFALSFIGMSVRMLPGMLAGALVGLLPFLIAALRKPGSIGGADIKLMAASGWLLGCKKIIPAILAGLAAAIIVTLIVRTIKKTDRNKPFPLIPYLSAAVLLMYSVL